MPMCVRLEYEFGLIEPQFCHFTFALSVLSLFFVLFFCLSFRGMLKKLKSACWGVFACVLSMNSLAYAGFHATEVLWIAE